MDLSAGDDLHDFQPISGVEPALGKLGRRDRLAVVLHHHAARQEFLREEEFLDCARQPGLDGFSIGDDNRSAHEDKLSNSLCVPIQIHSITSPCRTPTARYWSDTRTDQTWSRP